MFIYTGLLVFAVAIYVPRFVPALDKAAVDVSAQVIEAETFVTEEPLPSQGPVRALFRLPGFFTTLMLNFTYLWMVGAVYNTLLALFARDELGVTTAGIGGLFALAVGVEMVVLFPAGAWADRYGRRWVMVPSLIGLTISLVLMGFVTTVWMLAGALVLLAITGGFAGVPPAAMLSDVVPEQQKGRAVGVFRFFGDLGFFLAPIMAGTASKNFGFKTAFILTAIPSAVAVILALRTAETLKEL